MIGEKEPHATRMRGVSSGFSSERRSRSDGKVYDGGPDSLDGVGGAVTIGREGDIADVSCVRVRVYVYAVVGCVCLRRNVASVSATWGKRNEGAGGSCGKKADGGGDGGV